MERGSSTGQVEQRGQNSGLKTVPTGFGNKEATAAEHIQKSVRRRRNLDIFAAGDDYVLGHDLPLQHAQLGMVATATEKPRRFCLEVSNPLSLTIIQKPYSFSNFILLFGFQFPFLAHLLPSF